ncbi:MAG: type IV secretion system DNA-binding domain-containing protein [Bacteroidota bacterium]
MSYAIQDILTQHFYEWEQWGRGIWVADEPITLEPPFLPFDRSRLVGMEGHIQDDGHFHTPLSFLWSLFKPAKPPEPKFYLPQRPEVQLDPFPLGDPLQEIAEFQVRWPKEKPYPKDSMSQLLVMLGGSKFPISFELIGTGTAIITQFACRGADADLVRFQLQVFFPQAEITPTSLTLLPLLYQEHQALALTPLCLQQEFMRPLTTVGKLEPDPLTAAVGALESLAEGQVGIIQILFQGCQAPWGSSIMASVQDGAGGSFFPDASEMLSLVKDKLATPLISTTIRTVGISPTYHLSQKISLRLAQALNTTTKRIGSNALGVLETRFTQDDIQAMVMARRSFRTGMILSTQELLPLVHLLSPSLASSKFKKPKKTKAAPPHYRDLLFRLGINEHQGQEHIIGLDIPTRLRHTHIIGATGTGKSTLLVNMIRQDMKAGIGCAVFDPHGDLIEDVLGFVPYDKMDKVVIIDPSDEQYAIGVNILQAQGAREKIMLASDLAEVFKRHTTSWGDQMEVIMQNTIAAFLDSSKGGTLLDLRQFLLHKGFREQFLHTVSDPMIREFFQYDFPQKRNSTLQSLLSRLQFFLRPKPIRYMLMQQQGLNFSKLIEDGAIILIKLSQGLIGESNSYLLGTLLLTKLYQAALGRQSQTKDTRKPFFIYLDEFQHFITPTLEGILSGARKYGLGLVLAHQSLDQLMKRDALVGNAVLSNAGTRICFRVSDTEAVQLAKGFSFFEQEDIKQLGVGETIIRIGSSEHDCNVETIEAPYIPEIDNDHRVMAKRASQTNHGTSVFDLEEQLQRYYDASRRNPTTTEKEQTPLPPKREIPPVTQPPVQEEKPVQELPSQNPIPELIDLEKAAEDFKAQEKQKKEQSEHRYLQTFLKQMAEARGYRSVLEAPTPDGNGRVDVLLSKGDETIALEVAVTTTNAHEVGNISKCLKAGYTWVILLSSKPKRRENIEALAKKSLTNSQLKGVHFLSPEAFISWLDTKTAKEANAEKTVKGYRVKVNYSNEKKDSKTVEEDLSKILSRSIRRKK